jgi:hypothetical protein
MIIIVLVSWKISLRTVEKYTNHLWTMEMDVNTDISALESQYPLSNAYFYGDSPRQLQQIFDQRFNEIQGLELIPIMSISWTPKFNVVVNTKVVEQALEEFLLQSLLRNKGYYVVASKLISYDHDMESIYTLMHLKTCIYIPYTTHAKTVDMHCVCYINKSFIFDRVNVVGVVHESFLILIISIFTLIICNSFLYFIVKRW